MLRRETIPIVYHFFPHYRTGVNRALALSKKYEFLFVGDTSGGAGSTIEPWRVPEETPFLRTRNVQIGARTLFQTKVVGLALRRDLKTIIFLGAAQLMTTWLAAAAARLTGKRVLFWSHGWTSPDQGVKRFCRMAFYRLAHGLLLYGHHAKRIAVEMGLPPTTLHVVYNSLDYPTQAAVRQQVHEQDLVSVRASLFGARDKSPMLICSGRLVPMRRLDLLLEAMTQLKQQKRPCNLVLVGDGPESGALKHQARQNGLAVHFYGTCYDERVLARLFMASDLLVMPGRVGLAAIHSLAYGTPVLIHDNPNDQGPEWESILPGFNGARFAHGDSRDLARVLRQWFDHAPDRNELRRQCYEIVERFYNPATQASLIERALDDRPADDSDWERFLLERREPRRTSLLIQAA